jgi:hypothetical protein
MMISGLGYSSGGVTDTQISSKAGSSTDTSSIVPTGDSLNSVLNGTSKNSSDSNAGYLFSKLNTSILYTGDLSGVQSAIDTYTQSLPSSNVYMSSYTAPSAQYLNDLTALGSAANGGNLVDTELALAKAKLDAPEGISAGVSIAASRGDTAGETGLFMEAASSMADYLITQGNTSVDAHTEANTIVINAVSLVGKTSSDPLSAQTRLAQITDLASSVANEHASTKHGAVPTSSDPMFNIIENLLKAHSSTASNATLAALDLRYGSGITASNATQDVPSAAGVSSYA